MASISIKQHIYQYTLQRQVRKTLQLQLTAIDTLCVKAPKNIKLDVILAFIQQKADWIQQKNNILQEQPLTEASLLNDLKDGSILLFKGNETILRVKSTYCKPAVTLAAQELCVNLYAPRPQDLRSCLKTWFILQAKKILLQKTQFWCNRLNTNVGKITIREQKTRWGSCSSLGNINYNWRIIMAPEKTIDYLVIHEVSHRHYMNHSKEFWHLVQRHQPDYTKHKLWLKQHSHEIFQMI
jgi:hypothetical protein